MSPRLIRIAARHSDLARLQAYRVGDALKNKFPTLEIQYSFRASLGDQNLEDPLWKMPEKGVFTEDFVRDLHEGTADLVVHSWKDLPTELRPGLSIAATLPRADQRDLLLFRRGHLDQVRLSKRLRVLTSSPRRAFNLDGFFKSHLPFEITDVSFENVRGNIPTRMKKLLSGEADALIVAKAAVDRLLEAPEDEFEEAREVIRGTLRATLQMVLPLALNPTAAAQGALAVEIRSDRSDLAEVLSHIHCHSTFDTVVHERKILSSYGGGCHQKIGISILDRPFGRVTYLQGLTDSGERLSRVELKSSTGTEIEIENCREEADLYPNSQEPETFFGREFLSKDAWARAEKSQFLWVARETAWPKDLKVSDDVFVWTAGLMTWQKLAKQGVWVSGSSEGLGERENEALSAVALARVGKEPRWLKLTHETAASKDPGACATYRLVANSSAPDLRSRTHFYWMSGTAFDRAVELNPSLLNSGVHASGPGKTHEHLKTRLAPAKIEPLVFLSVDHFRSAALRPSTPPGVLKGI